MQEDENQVKNLSSLQTQTHSHEPENTYEPRFDVQCKPLGHLATNFLKKVGYPFITTFNSMIIMASSPILSMISIFLKLN